MKNIFTADQFTPTKCSSADDKAWFANQFVKFVSSGFKQFYFTKRFYNRLNSTFGHIAHYSQFGFWDVFFTNTSDKVSFLRQTLEHPCYGSPDYTYCDVERAIQGWLQENNVLANLIEESAEEQTALELATLARLKAKYEHA